MRIVDIESYPISFPIPEGLGVSLGIGRAVKRDAVLVKVSTESGIQGWGEAHAGRAPGAVAHLLNSTLRDLVMGCEARPELGVNSSIEFSSASYKKPLLNMTSKAAARSSTLGQRAMKSAK